MLATSATSHRSIISKESYFEICLNLVYRVLESRIDSAYFGKRVVSLGQLLTEIAGVMD